MKKKNYRFLLLIPLLLSVLVLTGCKVMMPSDYKKVKEIIIEDCNKVGLHGKVTITNLRWTALEFPTYHVSYIYSEKAHDGQTIKLEEKNIAILDGGSIDSSDSTQFLEYKEVFVKQKSLKKVGEKIKNQLNKQSLGFSISSVSFDLTDKFTEKEEILDSIASENLKEGKNDFAGYYQIPYQTLIDEELIETTINIDDTETVELKDLKNATEKLDARDLPNGNYRFFYFTPYARKSYSFKVEDGEVSISVRWELILEDKNQRWEVEK